MTSEPDALRFSRWQRDALAARPANSTLLGVGPFKVVIPDSDTDEPWVTLIDAPRGEAEIASGIEELHAMLDSRASGWQLEYNDGVLSKVEAWLVRAGLHVVERNPLMACRPAGFRPFAARDVILEQLDRKSSKSELESFQRIRWTDGGAKHAEVPAVERLIKELASRTSVYLIARLDDEPAGTGVSHTLNGAAEIVGVVTRIDRRRRGVAATVTSELVARHFRSGGDFVFLDASGEDAARVYERLGFSRFGANLILA